MTGTIDVTIPVDADLANWLNTTSRLRAAGRLLSAHWHDGAASFALAEAISELKREAREQGLTDKAIDDELEAWRAERAD